MGNCRSSPTQGERVIADIHARAAGRKPGPAGSAGGSNELGSMRSQSSILGRTVSVRPLLPTLLSLTVHMHGSYGRVAVMEGGGTWLKWPYKGTSPLQCPGCDRGCEHSPGVFVATNNAEGALYFASMRATPISSTNMDILCVQCIHVVVCAVQETMKLIFNRTRGGARLGVAAEATIVSHIAYVPKSDATKKLIGVSPPPVTTP
jgi:hypothetical protein